jgi:hypothetical protein
MEKPNISTPALEEKLKPEKPKFKKNDFTITLDSMGDGFEMFIQKSADALFGLGKNIKKFFASKKIKKKNYTKTVKLIKIRRKTPAERQYELSKKIYREHRKLERQLEKIETSLTKTHELAGQINT